MTDKMADNRMTELLPCPWCGGEAEKMTSSDGFTSIGCLRCNPIFGVMIQRNTEAEAIAAWNTRATHGTLTAEQVRETVQHVYHEGYSDGSVRRGAHIDETDWQAIADELNAKFGGRTCSMEYGGDVTESTKRILGVYFCSECGSPTYNDCMPCYCMYCGKQVKR